MKSFQDRPRRERALGVEADLEATIHALFRRWPGLCGFSVQDASTLSKDRASGQLEGELHLADLGVCDWPGDGRSGELLGDIAVALLDLIDERPEARELLPGRTFTRALH